ncbi:MAG: hypothetical protein HQL97_07475 [Magnetococcales bacterium]|nr:hypothetical protein [Magnetococcales bacterium]
MHRDPLPFWTKTSRIHDQHPITDLNRSTGFLWRREKIPTRRMKAFADHAASSYAASIGNQDAFERCAMLLRNNRWRISFENPISVQPSALRIIPDPAVAGDCMCESIGSYGEWSETEVALLVMKLSSDLPDGSIGCHRFLPETAGSGFIPSDTTP